MTPSRLFAPAPPRTAAPWPTVAALVVACLVGAVMLTHFIDALHLSMARGAAFRAAQHTPRPAEPAAGQPERVMQLRLPLADR